MRATSLTFLSASFGSLAAASVMRKSSEIYNNRRPPVTEKEPDWDLLPDCVVGEDYDYDKYHICKAERKGLHLLNRDGSPFGYCFTGDFYEDYRGVRFVTVEDETPLCYDKTSEEVFDQIGTPVGKTEETEKYKTLDEKEDCAKGKFYSMGRDFESELKSGSGSKSESDLDTELGLDDICRTDDGKLWQKDGSPYDKCRRGEVFQDNQGKLAVTSNGKGLMCWDKNTRQVMNQLGGIYGTAPGPDEESGREMMEGCVTGDFLWTHFLRENYQAFCLTKDDGRVWYTNGTQYEGCQDGTPIIDKQGQRAVSDFNKRMLCWNSDARLTYDLLGNYNYVERQKLEEWGLEQSCVKGSVVGGFRFERSRELELCEGKESRDLWHLNGTLFEGCRGGQPLLDDKGERVVSKKYGRLCKDDENDDVYDQVGKWAGDWKEEDAKPEAGTENEPEDCIRGQVLGKDFVPDLRLCLGYESDEDDASYQIWHPNGTVWEGCRVGEPHRDEQGVRVSDGKDGLQCRDSDGRIYTQLGEWIPQDEVVCAKGERLREADLELALCAGFEGKADDAPYRVWHPDGTVWQGCRVGEPYEDEQGVRVSDQYGLKCRDGEGQVYDQLGEPVEPVVEEPDACQRGVELVEPAATIVPGVRLCNSTDRDEGIQYWHPNGTRWEGCRNGSALLDAAGGRVVDYELGMLCTVDGVAVDQVGAASPPPQAGGCRRGDPATFVTELKLCWTSDFNGQLYHYNGTRFRGCDEGRRELWFITSEELVTDNGRLLCRDKDTADVYYLDGEPSAYDPDFGRRLAPPGSWWP